jgi:hypothetical protein
VSGVWARVVELQVAGPVGEELEEQHQPTALGLINGERELARAGSVVGGAHVASPRAARLMVASETKWCPITIA